MRYKKLGSMDVSVITAGTWVIGGRGWGEVEDADSIKALQAMMDGGVNLIDTAPAYNFGHSEEVVGQAVKGRRDKVMIASKFGNTWRGEEKVFPLVRDNSRKNIFYEWEQSAKRLGVDCIDIYLAHWPDKNVPLEETVTALADLKKQGKIRFIGLSNHNQELLTEALKYAHVDIIQPQFSMLNRAAAPLMGWALEKGVATMTYGSLASGLLTGAIRENPNFAADDFRSDFYGKLYQEPKFSQTQELLKAMDRVAEAHNVPVVQVAINWQTQNPLVTTALMGVRNVQEAKDNCAAMEWELSKEELAQLDQAILDTVG